MEKNRDFDIGWGSNVIKKMFRTMKVFICILVLSLSSVTASTFSQVRVSIDVKNATLKEVFKEITKLTGYEFVYSNNEIERIGKVSLNVSNKDLKDVLAECLKGTQLWYMIEEQVVVISPKLLQAESKDVNKATIASGRVVGEDKKPIPGVTVLLKGTSTGVTTGVDGVFFIMVPDTTANVEFIFSFVGMKTKTVAYKSRPKTGEWLITMEEDLLEMDEVVVTGYTTLSRRETASAVSQIKADDVMLNSKSSIDQMLIGQIPGMTIVQTSGEPSATPKIRIRGISSITSSKAPVWVLDGVILEDPVNVDYSQINGDDAAYLIGNAIAGINPRDIETITVLKDASATAIYGVQAANGVIVLTTKQGKEGKAQLNYNTSMTLNQRPSYGDFYLMNAAERIQLSQDIIAKSLEYGRVPVSLGYEGLYMDYMNRKISYEDFALGTKRMAKRNTDWYDILFRNVLSHNHTLSINGGSKDTRYYASIGFDQNFGTAEGSVSKRYTTMMKLNSWLNDQVFVGVTLNGNVTENKGFHSSVNPNQYAYETSRTIPCYNEDGSLFYYETRQKGQLASNLAPREEMLYNIVHELGQTGSTGKVAGITGQVNLQWRIKYGFKYDFLGSYSYQQSKQNSYAKEASNYVGIKRKYNVGSIEPNSLAEDNSVIPIGGIIDKSETEQTTYMIRNTIGFSGHWGDHEVSASALSEIRGVKQTGFSGTYYGWMPERGQTLTPMLTSAYVAELANLRPRISDNLTNYVSWAGTLAYTWREKITLNGNIRMDGSNKFGENPKYRFLPIWSIAGRYTLTEEPFVKGSNIISLLALKASYGIQGNIDKSTSPELVIQVGALNTVTRLNESFFEYLPNADLRWEKTTSYNLGLEIALLKDRIQGEFNYYFKKGEDMIMSKKVSQSMGLSTVKINGGRIDNSGCELTFRFYPIRTADYAFSVNFVYSYNKNELVSANSDSDITNSEMLNGSALIEGKPMGTFYSYRFAGLNGETGYPTFYDKDGKNYSEVDGVKYPHYALYEEEIDLVKSGCLDPTTSGSLGLNFRYKNFRIDLGFTYTLGAHRRLPNIYRQEYYKIFDPLINVTKELKHRWNNPGDENSTIFPALYDNRTYNQLNQKSALDGRGSVYYGTQLYDKTDVRVAKIDNVRLRNLSLMYRIPTKILEKIKIQDISFNFQATNLFQIAAKEWRGRDPESGDSNTPIPRTYSLGLNVTF